MSFTMSGTNYKLIYQIVGIGRHENNAIYKLFPHDPQVITKEFITL